MRADAAGLKPNRCLKSQKWNGKGNVQKKSVILANSNRNGSTFFSGPFPFTDANRNSLASSFPVWGVPLSHYSDKWAFLVSSHSDWSLLWFGDEKWNWGVKVHTGRLVESRFKTCWRGVSIPWTMEASSEKGTGPGNNDFSSLIHRLGIWYYIIYPAAQGAEMKVIQGQQKESHLLTTYSMAGGGNIWQKLYQLLERKGSKSLTVIGLRVVVAVKNRQRSKQRFATSERGSLISLGLKN